MALNEAAGSSAINFATLALANQPVPDEPTKPEGSAPKTGTGSLGGPSVAQQQTETLQRADTRIAEGAAYAGVTLRPTTNHVDRFTNAIAVYNKLVENASYSNDPEVKGAADKFLLDMGKIGEKFGLNFGLSTAPTEGNPKGTPLNQGKFAGIDYKTATDDLLTNTNTLLEQNKAAAKEPLWGNNRGSSTSSTTSPKTGEELQGGGKSSAVADSKIQLPDLRSLDVKGFMAAVNNDGDKSFVSIEEIRAAVQNDKLPSAGREYLQKVHLDQFPVGTTGVLIDAGGVQRNLEINQAKQLGNGQATIQDVPASPPEKLWG
jgi:hypothetical protein